MHYVFPFCSSIITTLILTLIPSLIHSKTLDSDIEVLHFLKESIDPVSITSSSFLNTWDFNIDPCDNTGGHFLGIICTIPLDNSTSRITVVDLDGMGYDGFIPPEIGNLSELTILDLSKNNFRGPIPYSIFTLSKLTTLSLSDNFFTGRIPIESRRLMQLEILDLSNNRLFGSIPTAVSAMRSSTYLGLANNRFSGRIPDLHGLWQLSTLDLSGNRLHGNLSHFPTNLRTLSLSHNKLSGNIFSITELKELRTLDLSDNLFSGAIADGILTLPKVTRINVSVNSFTAINVVNFYSQETQLQILDAHRNRLRGHLPLNLVSIENLTTINLGHNNISGQIPIEYGEKLGVSWRSLFLESNFLVGRLPHQFSDRAMRITGSLASNCLTCPRDVPLCRGGQRPALECPKETDLSSENLLPRI